MPNFIYDYLHSGNIDDISDIGDGMYISNWYTSVHTPILESYRIKHVMCFSGKRKTTAQLNLYAKRKISHHMFPVGEYSKDPSSVVVIFNRAVNVLEGIKPSDTNRCLIHCTAGRSRSCAFMIYYLIHKHKHVYDTVYNFVKAKRPAIKLDEHMQTVMQIQQMSIQLELDKKQQEDRSKKVLKSILKKETKYIRDDDNAQHDAQDNTNIGSDDSPVPDSVPVKRIVKKKQTKVIRYTEPTIIDSDDKEGQKSREGSEIDSGEDVDDESEPGLKQHKHIDNQDPNPFEETAPKKRVIKNTKIKQRKKKKDSSNESSESDDAKKTKRYKTFKRTGAVRTIPVLDLLPDTILDLLPEPDVPKTDNSRDKSDTASDSS